MRPIYKFIFAAAIALPGLSFAKRASACDQFDIGKMTKFRDTLKEQERHLKYTLMEQAWNELVALKCPLLPTDYALGGTAVRWQGDIALAIQYYEKSTTPDEAVKLKAAYALLNTHHKLAPAALRTFVNITPGVRQLSREQSATLTRAKNGIANGGGYSGYVLPGKYRILGKEVELKAGETVEINAP